MSNQSKIQVLPRVPYSGSDDNAVVSVRLHGDGTVIRNLTVLGGYDGERSREASLVVDHRLVKVRLETGTLTSEGGVEFRTEKGKKLFLRYTEFSFLFSLNNQNAA